MQTFCARDQILAQRMKTSCWLKSLRGELTFTKCRRCLEIIWTLVEGFVESLR